MRHTFDGHLLLIVLSGPLGLHQRMPWVEQAQELLDALRPGCLVVELPSAFVTAAALSAVLRTHDACARRKIPMAVASLSLQVRGTLNANNPDMSLHAGTVEATAAVTGQVR
ncbi:hypothetical protein ACFWIN_21260 [Streptomyces sp. NPDC127049]|uniref:hypothetical protein n=1 Tax=Streptomyces sp. NPDC127049 TaxID=3347118 RepID=UPI00365F3B2A